MAGKILKIPNLVDCLSLLRVNVEGRRVYAGESPIFSGLSRELLYEALKDFKKGTRILVPNFICDSVIATLTDLDFHIVSYPVKSNLLVDYENLPGLINCKVFITVNYFGLPQDMDRARHFAEVNDLVWVNDNAHGFGSNYRGTPLENYGDISITSFRKVIPSTNGAFLILNSKKIKKVKSYSIRSYSLLFIKLLLMDLRLLFGASLRFLKLRRTRVGVFYQDSPRLRPQLRFTPVTPLSYLFWILFDSKFNMLGRQKIYSLLISYFETLVYPAVSSLAQPFDEEASPLCFPLMIQDKSLCRDLLNCCSAHGIDAYPWPTADIRVQTMDSDTSRRDFSIVCLPTNPLINAEAYLVILNHIFCTELPRLRNYQ